MSVVTYYAVEWEVGGTTGVGVTIGEGVVPGGVNLSSTLEGRYATQFDQGIQQTTAWELPAEPDTVVEYTLMWREIWQPGYVEIRLADKSVVRANVRYRTGIQSDIVGKRVENCSGEPIATQVYPTTPPQASVSTTEPFCAFVTQSQVEELKTLQDVASAIRKAEEFAGYRQNDYTEGSTIPAGVLIATELLSTHLEQFGVIPINNGGGWGLFLTTREFQAPNAGTYWCIQETSTNAFNAKEPLIINGRSFSVPNDTTVKCVAREQTGYTNTDVEYNLTIPTGWVIVWDSWKAYWPNGKYEQDGLLTIYGRWEGKVTIVNGEYCAVPIEWKDFAINDRMSAVSSSNRQSFSIGEAP
jgi:hypothetical protein